MGHNGKDEIMVREIDCPMVEIKIKTLDSQTYTLRVDKCVPVPALKEQVASVTGVVTEQQRLICRGKVLKDDQLLSAYHVEDGHTLHLVVRQPIPPLSESSTSNGAADPAMSAGESQGSQRSRVLVGSFNIAEQGDYLELGHLVSAVLGSLGISGTEGGIEGIEAMGPLHERLSRSSGPSTARDSSEGRSVTPNAAEQTSSQPSAIQDSLTTISENLNSLRQGFAASVSNANNVQGSEDSSGRVQDSGSTGGESRIPRPSHLAEVLRLARQLVTVEVADCLSSISRQLEDHVNVTDPSSRRLCQANMFQSGALFENLGSSFLEIGRAIMMLRLGQTPDDAVVNTGPAVYISPTGRNPLPSRSSRLGTSIGGLQAGTGQSSPFAGQSLTSVPRNIEIRIRTGSWVPSSETNQREESVAQQTNGQAVPSVPSSVTDSAPSVRGSSDPPRNPVALVIPVVARYQQVSSVERSSSTGLDAESSRQPPSTVTPGSEGDSTSAPGGRGLSDLRNRIHQFLRPLSRREQAQMGTPESQVAANPSATTASTETNEGGENTQAEAASGSDEGQFLSSVLQHIMPLITQNVPSSSSDEAAGRGSNSGTQASSREEEDAVERGDSSRRREAPSPPESKRQKRE